MIRYQTLGALALTLTVSALAGIAEARLPAEDEMERVRELAYQLEIDTDEVYVEAVHSAKAGDEREEEALQRLYMLKESAGYFYEQVEVSYEASKHTAVAFERLNNDFIEAREEFDQLRAYRENRDLFETIEDSMGNLRFYYVAEDEYGSYPDYETYPYYPGFHLFVHVGAPGKQPYFRNVHRWHLHPDHYKRFPHRVDYRLGYGRYKIHFTAHSKFGWHKKVVKPKHVTPQKPKPKAKRRP